jgi:hypothetical protein
MHVQAAMATATAKSGTAVVAAGRHGPLDSNGFLNVGIRVILQAAVTAAVTPLLTPVYARTMTSR